MNARTKILGIMGALFIFQLLLQVPAYAKSVVVTDSQIRMYQECSTDCKKYVTIKKGEELTLKDTNGNWAKVEYKGKKGYALKDGLEPVSEKSTKSASKTASKGKDAWASEALTVYKSADRSGGSFGDIDAGTKVELLDTKGDWAKIVVKGETGFVKKSGLTSSAKKASTSKSSSTSKAKSMDWWESNISSIYSIGTTATITDVATGISWKEVRKGGSNHADVQPVTAKDTAKFKKAVGGEWTWDRRPIWVTIKGKKYAASMNCMPHGEGSITGNDFPGHNCIHFTNSRTHGSDRIDEEHQAAIKKALK